MSRGSRKWIIGPTRPSQLVPSGVSPPPSIAEFSHCHAATGLLLPNHPSGMNMAVMSPQAMNAAMLGMIMPDRNVPNLWTATRAPPPRGVVVSDVVVIVCLLAGMPDYRPAVMVSAADRAASRAEAASSAARAARAIAAASSGVYRARDTRTSASAVGDIDRLVTPRPASTTARRGSAAASPQTPTGFPAAAPA